MQEEAIKTFQQALRIDPNDAWARWQLGALYKTQNRLDEAIQEFEEVLRRGAGSLRESTEHWLKLVIKKLLGHCKKHQI
jgi:tetratricopeptide (TPR) repeat protein